MSTRTRKTIGILDKKERIPQYPGLDRHMHVSFSISSPNHSFKVKAFSKQMYEAHSNLILHSPKLDCNHKHLYIYIYINPLLTLKLDFKLNLGSLWGFKNISIGFCSEEVNFIFLVGLTFVQKVMIFPVTEN